VAVTCFMVKSCIHTVRPPGLCQNMPYLSSISLASTEFHKIPRKHRNSAEMSKFCGSAQNSVFRGKLWSLLIMNGFCTCTFAFCLVSIRQFVVGMNTSFRSLGFVFLLDPFCRLPLYALTLLLLMLLSVLAHLSVKM